ncbi:polyprenol monophosphomannose synthase [Flavobacteriaceae bacterium]|nr:polyprenol monophosphomannose synthase [Flavobacteriaceae bacterium]MDC0408777.1 polyprenol monophosphomannose synthase [Flavobacteriaceae bacterium]
MAEGLIIIPTFNESENIEKLLRNVFSLQRIFSVLVVDDGSPDGTAEIVERLIPEYAEHLNLLKRTEKSGLGRAYLAGFEWALKRDYSLIFEMDADFSHNPNDLIRLYNCCTREGYDMAIGSRYITGVNVVNWPMSRVLLSWGASKYVQWVTGMNIKDTTAGFVCYRREVLEGLDLSRIRFVGYAFQIEMKYKAFLKGFKIKEIPVIFTDRTRGTSKMSKGIISEAIFGVLKMRFKKLLNRLDI